MLTLRSTSIQSLLPPHRRHIRPYMKPRSVKVKQNLAVFQFLLPESGVASGPRVQMRANLCFADKNVVGLGDPDKVGGVGYPIPNPCCESARGTGARMSQELRKRSAKPNS